MYKNPVLKSIYKLVSIITVVVFMVMVLPTDSLAAGYVSVRELKTKVLSNNIHDHNYSSIASVTNSYLTVCPDGTIARIEDFDDVLLLERYNSKYQMVGQRTVGYELPKFAGFYAGEKYNYFVFGQDNPYQAKDREVLRIVRYTKDFRRIDHASLFDCNSREIVTLCNSSFAEYNGILFVRVGHRTYKEQPSGVTRQSVMTVCYNSLTGKIDSNFNSVNSADWGAIEDIGATYMEASGGRLSFADQSLTRPYCAMISTYNRGAALNTMLYGVKYIQTLGAKGALGTAIPEFSIGGMTASPQHYIVVGATVPLDGSSPNNNVFIELVPKNSFSANQVKLSFLTGYGNGDTKTTTNPFIVKVNDNLFAVLWEERDGYTDLGKVKYVYIDGNGNRIGNSFEIDGCLSDCQPIVYGNDIVWYITDGKSVKMYSIPATAANAKHDTYAPTVAANNLDYSKVYDYHYYMNMYPDMRVLYSNDEKAAFEHFLRRGMLEGRCANPNFNVAVYINNYPELVALYGNDLPKYYIHYITTGYAEGRNAMTRIR